MNQHNKKRIALTVLSGEKGHQNDFGVLAHRLEQAGFNVTFIGLIDEQATFEQLGFDFLAIAPDKLPKGYWAQQTQAVKHTRSVIKRALKLKQLQNELEDVLHDFATGISDKFDLIIADALVYHGILVAAKAQIPVILLETTLPFKNPYYPDLFSQRTLKADGSLSLYCRWKRSTLGSILSLNLPLMISNLFTLAMRQWLLKRYETDTVKFGVNISALPQSYGSIQAHYASIIACPQSFEFDQRSDAKSFYIDALMSQVTQVQSFDWPQEAMDKSVVYVSLGSQVRLPKEEALSIYLAIIDAFADQQDKFVIIAAGEFSQSLASVNTSTNVQILKWAPQRAILEKAAMMITHGGLNSIKECIYAQVPMICIPIGRDQPGNSVRVEHHRLGFMAPMEKISACQIAHMASELEYNPIYRLCLNRMKQKFDEAEENNVLIDIVNNAIA